MFLWIVAAVWIQANCKNNFKKESAREFFLKVLASPYYLKFVTLRHENVLDKMFLKCIMGKLVIIVILGM